jgi:hypothetical protein
VYFAENPGQARRVALSDEERDRISWPLGLVLAALASDAIAEELVFRFEAPLQHVAIQPPKSSVAAQAANRVSITGTFGFSIDAAVAASARIPGRVGFASYDAGFIHINGIDVSSLPGLPSMRVGNGITKDEDPNSTIKDDVIFSYRSVSVEEPIASMSLRFRYTKADALQVVALPTSFDLDDFDSVSLSFNHRIDSLSNRGEGQARPKQFQGLVHFDVMVITREE